MKPENDIERLQYLLRESSRHLEWAQHFAEGGPGTADSVKEINRLLGAIYYALGEETSISGLEGDEAGDDE